MNRAHNNHQRPNQANGRLLFALLVPILLTSLSGFGYAGYAGNLSTVAKVTSSTEDISITHCTIIDYNGFTVPPELYWDDTNIFFEDELLYPGWEIKLLTEITNTGTLRVQLWTNIYYSLDDTTWTPTTDDELLTLFCIEYTDGFYSDPGPDEKWFTKDDTPWTGRNGDYRLWPDPPYDKVYKQERLVFDAQDHPELQDKPFYIKVDVSATTSNGR